MYLNLMCITKKIEKTNTIYPNHLHAILLATWTYCRSSRPSGVQTLLPEVAMLITVHELHTIAHSTVNWPCLAFRMLERASLSSIPIAANGLNAIGLYTWVFNFGDAAEYKIQSAKSEHAVIYKMNFVEALLVPKEQKTRVRHDVKVV